jgi:hypothetical protein
MSQLATSAHGFAFTVSTDRCRHVQATIHTSSHDRLKKLVELACGRLCASVTDASRGAAKLRLHHADDAGRVLGALARIASEISGGQAPAPKNDVERRSHHRHSVRRRRLHRAPAPAEVRRQLREARRDGRHDELSEFKAA